MIIHVIQHGETIASIAGSYGVSAERIILDNGISDPDSLVVGESIVILFPEIIYIIKEGDTLDSIAESYGTTVIQLLRNNPYLSDREYIYPGEEIVIRYRENKMHSITTNGFAYPFINKDILKRTLPFLTRLTIYSYAATADGDINDIDDTEIIRMAKAYGTAPIMMLMASSDNMEEEIRMMHLILSNAEAIDRLINRLLDILQTKGYSGVCINIPYIYPADRSLYQDFTIKITDRITNAGYKVFGTLGAPTAGLDYGSLIRDVAGITLIVYEFGYSEGLPPGTLSMDTYRQLLADLITLVPPEKTSIGIPVMGYLWSLPYIPGSSRGMALSYDAAINLAAINNAEIQFDPTTNAAAFYYLSGNEYIVRFWDARSMDNFISFVPEFGLDGIGIWNIMYWFPQLWMVVNSQYEINSDPVR